MTPGSAAARIENESESGVEERSETAAKSGGNGESIAKFLGK
jgi:hypothetical protein